ncbi:GntR family transcriptional regulator [Kallotenue papyrolyticum]|uniref:GntR family transcriptional regulator n=1 Tax=Kallotenue papyrolyticum TaxID=1325125 RepID=UPI00047864EB|nr:GntR family transcriptional regulator [Kallotenue papyrolyticum]
MGAQTPTGRRFQTKQAFVYHTLRAAIMHGEFAPGQRLRTEELAQRLGVSPIPVREALQLLQSERLVELIPHVGARVAPISASSIAEIFAIMEGLERVATRVAAVRLDDAQVKHLSALLTAMDQALQRGHPEQWADLNSEFHLSIAAITAMPLLQELTARILDQWDRLRRHYLRGALAQRLEQAQREHHQIVAAMRARDYACLERLVCEHNRGALMAYTTYLARQAAPAQQTDLVPSEGGASVLISANQAGHN